MPGIGSFPFGAVQYGGQAPAYDVSVSAAQSQAVGVARTVQRSTPLVIENVSGTGPNVWSVPDVDPFAGGECLGYTFDGSTVWAYGANGYNEFNQPAFTGPNTVAYSQDGGATWAYPENDPFPGGQCNGLVIFGSLIVVSGIWTPNYVSTVGYSEDGGNTWLYPATDPFSGYEGLGLTVLGSTIWVRGADDVNGYTMAYSSDGMTWSNPTTDPFQGSGGSSGMCNGFMEFGSTIFAFGSSDNHTHTIAYSTDGNDWSYVTDVSDDDDPFIGGQCFCVAASGSTLWAGGTLDSPSSFTIALSTNGGSIWGYMGTQPVFEDPFDGGACYGFAWSGATQLAFGETNGGLHTIAFLTYGDDPDFEYPSNDPFAGGECLGLAFVGSVLLAWGATPVSDSTNTIAYSNDGGETWVYPDSDAFAGGICNTITASGSTILAGGYNADMTATVALSAAPTVFVIATPGTPPTPVTLSAAQAQSSQLGVQVVRALPSASQGQSGTAVAVPGGEQLVTVGASQAQAGTLQRASARLWSIVEPCEALVAVELEREIGAAQGQSSEPLPGALVWFAADQITSPPSSGSALSSWNDLSGNGYTASQGTSGDQPLYETNVLNGLPGVLFNTSNVNYMSVATATLNSTWTVYMVLIPNSVAPAGARSIGWLASDAAVEDYAGFYESEFFLAGVSGDNVGGGSPSTGTAYQYTGQLNGASSLIRVGGSRIATANGGMPSSGNSFTLGRTEYPTPGYLCEMLVYNAVHTTAQMQTVEAYLTGKWFGSAENVVLVAVARGMLASQTCSGLISQLPVQSLAVEQAQAGTLTAAVARSPVVVQAQSVMMSYAKTVDTAATQTQASTLGEIVERALGYQQAQSVIAGRTDSRTISFAQAQGCSLSRRGEHSLAYGQTQATSTSSALERVLVAGQSQSVTLAFAKANHYTIAATQPSATLESVALTLVVVATQAGAPGLITMLSRVIPYQQAQSSDRALGLGVYLSYEQGQDVSIIVTPVSGTTYITVAFEQVQGTAVVLGLGESGASIQDQAITVAFGGSVTVAVGQGQQPVLITGLHRPVGASAPQGEALSLQLDVGASVGQAQALTQAQALSVGISVGQLSICAVNGSQSVTLALAQEQAAVIVLSVAVGAAATQGQSASEGRELAWLVLTGQSTASGFARALARSLLILQDQSASIVVPGVHDVSVSASESTSVSLVAGVARSAGVGQSQSAQAGSSMGAVFVASQLQLSALMRVLGQQPTVAQGQGGTITGRVGITLPLGQANSSTNARALGLSAIASQGQAPDTARVLVRGLAYEQEQSVSVAGIPAHLLSLIATQDQMAGALIGVARSSSAGQGQSSSTSTTAGALVSATSVQFAAARLALARAVIVEQAQSATAVHGSAYFYTLSVVQPQGVVQQIALEHGVPAGQGQRCSSATTSTTAVVAGQTGEPRLAAALARSVGATQGQDAQAQFRTARRFTIVYAQAQDPSATLSMARRAPASTSTACSLDEAMSLAVSSTQGLNAVVIASSAGGYTIATTQQQAPAATVGLAHGDLTTQDVSVYVVVPPPSRPIFATQDCLAGSARALAIVESATQSCLVLASTGTRAVVPIFAGRSGQLGRARSIAIRPAGKLARGGRAF